MNPAPDVRYAISADRLMFKTARDRSHRGSSSALDARDRTPRNSRVSALLFAAAMNTRCVSFADVDVSRYPYLDGRKDRLTGSVVQSLTDSAFSYGVLRSVVEGISPKIMR